MKQAIIIIHGIGEQHPMNTLRGFVKSVSNELQDEKKPRIWYKPTNSTDLVEQRRVTMSPSRKRPPTDFYEYYWAHHVTDTKITHVFTWILRLLFSNPRHFTKSILTIWLSLWTLIIIIICGIVTGMLSYDDLNIWKTSGLIISAISLIVYTLFRYFLTSYLGDAARYFSGAPEHVKIRNEILKDGIRFLKDLTECGKYNRIILVGHSMGSVIAYDLLKYLWTEYNTQHGSPEKIVTEPLDELEKMVKDWPDTLTNEHIEAFQKAQESLWIQQRRHGVPWLVTDLVTVGSPLTHASFLLSDNQTELTIRKNDREFPTCPPVEDAGAFHFHNKNKNYELPDGSKRNIYFLHHAALFACTRWTNIYFPGDIIGGPVRAVFGKGIKDISASLPKRWLAKTLFSHTRYWDTRMFAERKEELPEDSSIAQIIKALRLNSRELIWQAKKNNTTHRDEEE